MHKHIITPVRHGCAIPGPDWLNPESLAEAARVLELSIIPDINAPDAMASLQQLQLA